MLQFFQQGKAIQQKYTLEDFLFRWKKVQRVVEKQSVNALLLVNGPHAGDSPQSAYLFNWLFLGKSGKTIYSNKYLHEIYSQIIVLINAEKSYIFIPPKAKTAFQHLIYGIPNCTIFCPTQNQYNNKQVLDTLKITFFYQMVENKKTLGIFLAENQQVKAIQKWPIIQSYALQPVGRTFFTLQHKVTNMNNKICGLFKNLDKHSLKNLVGQTSFSMQGHIKGATNLIQLTDRNLRTQISEKQLQQSLQQTVDIGLFDSNKKQQVKIQQKVSLRFGQYTSDIKVPSSKDIKIDSKFHLTLQHYDPYTELQVWRTYFLDTNLSKNLIVRQKQQQDKQSFIMKTFYQLQSLENVQYENQRAIMLMYLSLVQGTIQTISMVSKDYRNLKIQFLRQNILSKVNQGSSQIYKKQSYKSTDLQIWLQSYDSFGQPRIIDFKDVVSFKLTSTFYVVKCRLNNIFSPKNNEKLGSVVFSQCFLLQQGCFLLLTKNIPYFDFWATKQEKNLILEKLNPNYEFQALGKVVHNDGLKNRIFIPLQKLSSCHFNIPILNVKYFFHEKGIRIYSDKIGWHMIFYNEIQDLTIVNKIPGQWVLFRLKNPLLFQSLQSNILFIQFRGKAFQILLKKINNKQDPLKLNYLDQIPPLLAQNWYFTEQVLKKQAKGGALIHQYQILQQDFLWSFIEAKQLMILNMKDIKMNSFKALYQQKTEKKQNQLQAEKPKNKYSLIVITGTYGSNKYKLAQTLSKFGTSKHKYSIFNISTENLYSRLQPQVYEQMLNQYINDNNIAIQDQAQIIISIVPSWIDLTKLLPILNEKYYIRSILSKVNSNNFYSNKNKNLTENVLTFCLPGYSQNIVLDTAAGDDDNMLSSISKILWVFNSQAKIFRANNSTISTGQCNDIIKDESFTKQYSQFLRNKYSLFYRFDALNSLSINYLEFKLPIYDMDFAKSLSRTNGYIINYKSILEELKEKKKQAQNSKDQLMLSLYQLEESITVVKRRQKVPYIRQIKGVVRLVNQEKQSENSDKEFVWANKDYREKLIAKDSKQKGLFIMSQNFNEGQVRAFFENFTYKKTLFSGIKEKTSIDKLTEEEKKNIERENRDKYLQNGNYFDGYFYRDVQGYILKEHPHLQKILQQWVNAYNQDVAQHNEAIKKEWEEYVKKY